MKIDTEYLKVIDQSTIKDNKLFLPDMQLDRKTYLGVNKVLESLGGKWNRKEKCHIFPNDIEDAINEAMLTGEYTDQKKEFNFFETPEDIAKKLVELACIKTGDVVLEPSAGKGAIAQHIILNGMWSSRCHLLCIEIMDDNIFYLTTHGYKVVHVDFLTYNEPCDVIIANPPFTKQQDIDHVNHMIKLAKRKVVSIMSSSINFRENKKTKEFRKLLNKYDHQIIALPPGAFKESGTMVNACIVVVNKE